MVATMKSRLRDPAVIGALLALVLALALYAPTLGYGLTQYDDSWLVRDNQIARDGDVVAIVTDLSPATRYVLGAEYLPVRDLSVAADLAIWGDWWGGHHLTSLLIYLAAIAALSAMLAGFGVPGRVVGFTAVLWAVHPVHAESVAWLAERKGVLSALFVGLSGWAYARFRRGGSAAAPAWLVGAAVAAVLAVWSKAPAVFAIAALGALELYAPTPRASWRRSLIGLATIALAAGLAFVPVLVTASNLKVVSSEQDPARASRVAIILGVHGTDVQLGLLARDNAATYPIRASGPSTSELVTGAAALVALGALVLWPRRRRGAPPPLVRAGAALWLIWWFPSSHVALSLQNLAADRYLLMPVLGLALIVAVGLDRLVEHSRARVGYLVASALVLTCAVRTLSAQASWRDGVALWADAVAAAPRDPGAWASYAAALDQAGEPELALAAAERGLAVAPDHPRLLLRVGLYHHGRGRPDLAEPYLRRAAEGGEARAMCNLALILQGRAPAEALAWARRGAEVGPVIAHCHRTHGKLALAARELDEARAAFELAAGLEPADLTNALNLGVVLVELGRLGDGVAQLERALADPSLRAHAERALAHARALEAGAPRPAGAVAGAPTGGGTVAIPDNVLIVLIDTVRADRLGAAGYRRDGASITPRLDAFAATATRFTRAYAQAPNTPRSLPSIFASRYPSQLAFHKAFHNFPAVLDANELLFEVLAAAGWRTTGFSSHMYFEARRNVTQGFAEYDNDGALTLQAANADIAAPRIVPRAIRRLEAFAAEHEAEPFAMFVHLFEPHSTYVDHAAYPVTEKGVTGLEARYDREIQFVDRWTGELLDALERTGLASSTIVVILSDHGEAFGVHRVAGERMYFHGQTLYDEVLRVPLLVRVPGLEPRVVDDVVGLIDVAPTLLDAFGVAAPASFVGRSLLPLIEGLTLPARPVFAELQATPAWPHAERAMISADGAEKLIVGDDGSELFDLTTDVEERHDRAAVDAAHTRALRAQLDAWATAR